MPRSRASVKIENVVASGTLNQRVDLNAIVKGIPRVEYRPEQFPGLIYRMDQPKAVFLLFASGKLVCTGAKREDDVFEALEKLHKRLEDQNLIFYKE
jgi:transcription initiation factor TFIID TATA-box-binding protein